MGHVAYVAQVNSDGTIVVEDYNWAPPHAYSNPPRVIPASAVISFIHIFHEVRRAGVQHSAAPHPGKRPIAYLIYAIMPPARQWPDVAFTQVGGQMDYLL